jgi:hypothetical protein
MTTYRKTTNDDNMKDGGERRQSSSPNLQVRSYSNDDLSTTPPQGHPQACSTAWFNGPPSCVVRLSHRRRNMEDFMRRWDERNMEDYVRRWDDGNMEETHNTGFAASTQVLTQ